ncbi:50S ribosomal protein L17 [Limnoglobus roseus]|uniref:Large ribosomal subunit protein bL17 n=1 Tax=Limnoglobus roseus TaxID=2598579 RepID=A0A5C1A890_9BACT|nr:50S ribosomal protein L17 [Limnoglobus roseus]QEL13378.1 50S ribosomal protein L17 [Limnoglobus roseus]
MRHRKAGRILGRNASHRLALFRNLSRALITHESIRTTNAKAKELRPFIEKLITLAKKGALADDGTPAGKAKALHYRRQAMAILGPTHGTGVYDKAGEPATEKTADTVLKKLFNVIGPRFKERPGGYTRIMKLHYRRLGDAGEVSVIEMLKEGETKVVRTKEGASAPAPAPVTTG